MPPWKTNCTPCSKRRCSDSWHCRRRRAAVCTLPCAVAAGPSTKPASAGWLRTVPCRHALQRVLAVQAVSQHYTQGLRSDAAHTGQILTEALNRLLLVGVSLDKTTRLDAYLAGVAAIHDNAIALDIFDPGQRRFASSLPDGGAEAERLPDPQIFSLLERSDAFAFSGEPLEQGWTLHVSLLRGPWMDKLVSAGLDILTLVAIALIFMVEMFLLLSRSLDARAHSRTADYAYRSSLFRPLMFVFVLAMDMSVSFIPLRMAELTAPGTLSRDVLLGLPISAEMGMTGLSVLVAGPG